MGDGVTGEDELWGYRSLWSFFLFQPAEIPATLSWQGLRRRDHRAGALPEVEYRAEGRNIFAKKPY